MADNYVKKINEATRAEMLNKSAQRLPNNLASQNWTPQMFKNYLTQPLFDNSKSFYAEINRIVDELNAEFSKLDFSVYSVAGLKGDVSSTDLANALLETKLFAKPSDYVPLTLGSSRIYGTNSSGSQTTFSYSTNADAGTIAMRKTNGNIATGTPTENNDAANKKYVDDLISTLNSMTILNKDDEAITATEETVQTVATEYVVANYSRQPKSKDGLILTINNDKILYVYSTNSKSWLDVSKEGKMVDLSNYYTKDDVYSKEETANLVESYAGLEVILTFEGTKESGTITFELVDGITLKNSTIYTLDLVYTGDISDTDVILLKDTKGDRVVLNTIKNADITTTATIKDIKQLHRVENGTHYWQFEARYDELTDSGITYKNMYTDCVINVDDAVQYVVLALGSGTLSDEQLALLQASKENKILYQDKVLSLSSTTSTALIYSKTVDGIEYIMTITVSSKGYALTTSKHTSYTAGTGITIENGVISVNLASAESTSF